MDVSVVRILRKAVNKDCDNLRRTIDRIDKQTALYMVKEISPEGLPHVHCLVHCLDPDRAMVLVNRINNGRCKSHIDKAVIYVGNIDYFMRYMIKDIKYFNENIDFIVRLYGKTEDILTPLIKAKIIVKMAD